MGNGIYKDWSIHNEDINFICPFCNGEGEITKEEYKELTKEEKEYFYENEDSATCEHCTNGYLEPIYNYKYPISCELTKENKKKAVMRGLFLFEEDDEVFMSLMGCGMDLSQNIGMAYLDIVGYIPEEWLNDINTQEGLNVSGKDYRRLLREIKKECKYRRFRDLSKIKECTSKISKSLNVAKSNPKR